MRKFIRTAALWALLAGMLLLLQGCGKKTHTVRFSLNGGELLSGQTEQTVEEGAAAQAPQTANGDLQLRWDKDFSSVTEDLVVSAIWEKPSYTVRFDLSGGELVSGQLEQTVEAGSTAQAPEAVNGHLSLSWDKDFSSITGDTVVTAQWDKAEMDTADLAEYVQARTVTVNITSITGNEAAGSGFFIDDAGTLVTNYHVIDAATTISVIVAGGGKYDVEKIVDFSALYDLAILKIDISGNDYLELSDEQVRSGQKVYAVGSALGTLTGTFTAGTVSSTARKMGEIDCLQMDAAISHGNSGGPLVNGYGEVVGINTFIYSSGENLNLAVKVETLEKLARSKNWSMQEYKEWYATESARSYSPWDGENYYYSTVNTYQVVTGASCLYSAIGDDYSEGYYDCCEFYVYNYRVSEFDAYIEYLKSIGFSYEDSDTYSDRMEYYYYNEKDALVVVFTVTSDNETLLIHVLSI